MISKLKIPKLYVKNLDLPIDSMFSISEIKKYKIKECTLYASISSDLFQDNKSHEYSEINFVILRISDMLSNLDLYHIFDKVCKIIKYKIVLVIETKENLKIGFSYDKLNPIRNTVKQFLLAQFH